LFKYRVELESIIYSCKQGELSLYCPQFALLTEKETNHEPGRYLAVEEFWFEHLSHCFYPTRKGGFTFISRSGFNALRPLLKLTFEAAVMDNGDWEDFEFAADKHFEKVNNRKAKLAEALKRRAVALLQSIDK